MSLRPAWATLQDLSQNKTNMSMLLQYKKSLLHRGAQLSPCVLPELAGSLHTWRFRAVGKEPFFKTHESEPSVPGIHPADHASTHEVGGP